MTDLESLTRKKNKTYISRVLAMPHVLTNTIPDTKETKVEVCRGQNVSKHTTDSENTKRRNEMILAQAMIIAPTHVRIRSR